MARRLVLVALFVFTVIGGATVNAVDPPTVEARGCSGYRSTKTPPRFIWVFRIHRRGSSIPARVERWELKKYVAVVMRSGAWPIRPVESAKVGAQAIKQYAWWHVLHRTRGYTWRGKCYDIRDGDQFIRGHWRPWHRIPERYSKVVDSIWDLRLIKNGRLFRTGWRGGSGNDDWHLYEDTIRRLAHRGWSFTRIIHSQLSPVTIRR